MDRFGRNVLLNGDIANNIKKNDYIRILGRVHKLFPFCCMLFLNEEKILIDLSLVNCGQMKENDYWMFIGEVFCCEGCMSSTVLDFLNNIDDYTGIYYLKARTCRCVTGIDIQLYEQIANRTS